MIPPTHTRLAVMICFIALDFEKWERTDRRTPLVNIVITNGRAWIAQWNNDDLFVVHLLYDSAYLNTSLNCVSYTVYILP